MRLQVKIDSTYVKNMIKKTQQREYQRILAVHGNDVVEKARQRILVTKVDPTGTPWRPWAPSTERYRRSKPATYAYGLLLDTHTMVNSFAIEVKRRTLHIINNTFYSVFHQYGTDTLPRRQFIDVDIQGLKRRIIGYLKS